MRRSPHGPQILGEIDPRQCGIRNGENSHRRHAQFDRSSHLAIVAGRTRLAQH